MFKALVIAAVSASAIHAEVPANLQKFWGHNEANAAALERLNARFEAGTQDLELGKRGSLSPRVRQPTKLDRPPRMVFPNRKAKDAWIASVKESLVSIRRGIERRESMRIPPAWTIERDGDIAEIDKAIVFQVLSAKEMLVRCEGKPQSRPLAIRQVPSGLAVRGSSDYLRAISDDNADEERRDDEDGDDYAGMEPGPTIMFFIRGVDTAGIVNESTVKIDRCFVATGTRTYPTIAGSNTVRVLELIDRSVIEDHWIKFRIDGRPTSKSGSKPGTVGRDED